MIELISRKMSDFTKFIRFRRSRDWKFSANSYMKVQMPQPDRRPRRLWSHFRILVTGKWNFTEFHVISRDFTNFPLFCFSLTKCQMLLDRQNSPYSQLLATTTLTKLISRTAQVLSLQQRIDIRKWFHEIFVLNSRFF